MNGQMHNGPQTLEESMASGWRLLRMLPSPQLARVSAQIAKYVTSAGDLEHACVTSESL